MEFIINFLYFFGGILGFQFDDIPIFLLPLNQPWKKIIIVAFEFFCVAYLLLIIGIPCGKCLAVLPILKNLLKFPLHPALPRLVYRVLHQLTALVGLADLDPGRFRGTGLATRCKVLLEIIIFGSKISIWIVV